jgi:hypothetical protein
LATAIRLSAEKHATTEAGAHQVKRAPKSGLVVHRTAT